MTKELDEAKTNAQVAAPSGAPVDPELAKERAEKANLEQLLAQEKAAHLAASSRVGEHTASLVRLTSRGQFII